MSTKEKVQVCIVENDENAYHVFEKLFKDSRDYDAFIIKAKGNDSKHIENARKQEKEDILNELRKRPFQILILDLLLRDKVDIDKEKVVGPEFYGIENVLSLEIALELKNDMNKRNFLPIFISSSKICRTHQQFEAIRDIHSDKVPEDAVFIFKPTEGFENGFFQNCPVDTGSNDLACNKDKKDKDGCPVKHCFFKLLEKYYNEFMEKQDNE